MSLALPMDSWTDTFGFWWKPSIRVLFIVTASDIYIMGSYVTYQLNVNERQRVDLKLQLWRQVWIQFMVVL